MSRAACSPFIKRGFTRTYTYKLKSQTSKIIDENAESRKNSIDIEEAWIKLNKDQQYKTQGDIMKQIEVFGQLKYFKNIIEEGGVEYLKEAFTSAHAVQTFPDEILFRQGNRAEDMYVLLEGKVNIFYIPYIQNLHSAEHESQENLKKKNMLIRTIKEGEAIGNYNLYYNKSFRNMAICATSCKLLQINRYTYLRTLMNADRISAESQFDFLRTVYLFSHWTDDQLIEILLQSSLEKVNYNSMIFNQNQKSTDFYIVKTGQYGFHEYGPLDHFGHQDIMDNKRRCSFVVCKSREGGEILRIKSSVFIQLILQDPISAKLLLKGKIEDQQIFNPQKRLQNFIDCQQNLDIDKYYKQIRQTKPFKSIDVSSTFHLHGYPNSNQQNSHQSSLFNIDLLNQTNKGSQLSIDHLDSPLTSTSKNGAQPTIKIHSRNLSLPKINTSDKHIPYSPLTSTHSKCKIKLNSPINNQIQSLNYLEYSSPTNISPISLNKSSLSRRLQGSGSQQSIKSGLFDNNIFLNNKILQSAKSIKPYKLSDIVY